MRIKKIFICDNSIDGIFTAIYLAWSSKYGHDNIKIQEKCEDNKYTSMELFSEYINVDTDYQLALKVSDSIKIKISEEAYQMVCRVALSDYFEKADLIYRFLILAFRIGKGILEQLSNEVVSQVVKTNRYVSGEVHHLLGFIRFSEQETGLLTSMIHPKNNVLSLIAPHFADRMSMEKFVIYDGNRKLAVLHVPGKPWIITDVEELHAKVFGEITLEEDDYQNLWKTFFKHITIKERINYNLQRNNLPLRFRKDMTEFHE